MKEENLVDDWVYEEIKNPHFPLVISFSGLGDEFNFRGVLSDMDVNVIYMRDLNHLWYLGGVPNVGNNVEEIRNFLVLKINELKATKVITIGVSAGGFASILYGSLIKADHILAFSPQTFMNKWNCIMHFDYRWLDRVIQIYNSGNLDKRFLDLKQLVRINMKPITIVFDSTHRLDNIHSTRLVGKSVICIVYQGGGHMLVKELRKKGDIRSIIAQVIN